MAEDNAAIQWQGAQGAVGDPGAPGTQGVPAAAAISAAAQPAEPAAGQPAAGQPPAGEKPADKPVDFNLAQAFAEARVAFDPAVAKEYEKVLAEAGVKDNQVANKLAGYVLAQEGKALGALYEEAVKEYGGTPQEPGEKFKEAQAKAGRAMEALEKKVPGLREALSKSPLDYDVRVLKALAAVGEVVGEDGNFMGGGGSSGAGVTARDYFPNSKY
ncbi:MAG: hypothetical protein LBO03_09270 [Acidaminococcales bacterium]|nr:hypothetical protein [Acidaminococcales bacterium]